MVGYRDIAKAALAGIGLEVRRPQLHLSLEVGHRRSMMKVLDTLARDGTVLSPALKQDCDNYAREVLGSIRHAPCLYVYSALQGRFCTGWIPHTYYLRHVVPRRKGDYASISSLQAICPHLFPGAPFPDICYKVNDDFFDQEMRKINSDEAAKMLFRDGDTVVFKADMSRKGRGVLFLTRENIDAGHLQRVGDGVFQRRIEQHPVFERYGSGAVATLRLTTVIDGCGAPSLRAAYLRLGRAAATHIKAGASIRVPLDRSGGELDVVGYLPDWRRCTSHPDSGETFAGRVVPSFADCVTLVLDLHRRVPFNACIGWDLTIDSNEQAQILEWNGQQNGIFIGEAIQGPCFADLGWERLWREAPARVGEG